MRTILLSMAVGLMLANLAVAADCCDPPTCAAEQACCGVKHSCGTCGAQKACQVVCEIRKVKKVVWRVECEEFCAPLPCRDRSCRSCKGCGKGCGDAGCGDAGCGETGCCEDACGGGCCEDPCADVLARKHVRPKCGKARTRKKLIRKEIICEVPSYKCIVAGCGACGGCGEAEEAAPTEAAPEEEALPPAPAPTDATRNVAPLPPVFGISYEKIIKPRR